MADFFQSNLCNPTAPHEKVRIFKKKKSSSSKRTKATGDHSKDGKNANKGDQELARPDPALTQFNPPAFTVHISIKHLKEVYNAKSSGYLNLIEEENEDELQENLELRTSGCKQYQNTERIEESRFDRTVVKDETLHSRSHGYNIGQILSDFKEKLRKRIRDDGKDLIVEELSLGESRSQKSDTRKVWKGKMKTNVKKVQFSSSAHSNKVSERSHRMLKFLGKRCRHVCSGMSRINTISPMIYTGRYCYDNPYIYDPENVFY